VELLIGIVIGVTVARLCHNRTFTVQGHQLGDMLGNIGATLAAGRAMLNPAKAQTAVFYSISNCQKGLRGVSFGNVLIIQVVEELRREIAGLTSFITLSPAPGLRRWATAQQACKLPTQPLT